MPAVWQELGIGRRPTAATVCRPAVNYYLLADWPNGVCRTTRNRAS